MDQTLVDAKIIKAVISVRKNTMRLNKSSFNPHGRYNYVPIDAYYEKIVPLASEAGLIWRARETDWELISHNEKAYVRSAYTYDLFVDGAEAKDYMKVTVCSPLTGPQTAGQMFSYADKVFMRVAFSVATGESDGDDVEQVESRSPPTPAHDAVTGELDEDPDAPPVLDTRTVDPAAVATIVAIFKTWLPKITARERLHDWHAENVAAIEKVGKIDRAAYDEIKAMFNARNTELKALEK